MFLDLNLERELCISFVQDWDVGRQVQDRSGLFLCNLVRCWECLDFWGHSAAHDAPNLYRYIQF